MCSNAHSYRNAEAPRDLNPAERRQLDADRRAWARRLEAIKIELATEPQRITDAYTVQATRVDPLGLVYLWREQARPTV